MQKVCAHMLTHKWSKGAVCYVADVFMSQMTVSQMFLGVSPNP